MPKPSHREDILKAGFELVILRGNCGASVRDVVQAAGVTLGSFSNHFPSKEAFYLELMERYYALVSRNIGRTLRNDNARPLARLEEWLDIQINFLKSTKMRSGCLIGNLSADAVEHSEVIRRRLSQIYKEIQGSVAYCLEAAVKAGELRSPVKSDELAQFLYSAIQGAILQSKVERSPAPLKRFRKTFLAVLNRLSRSRS